MKTINNAILRVPRPVNEVVRSFAPGTKDRNVLKQTLAKMGDRQIEIPLIIGGKEIRTGNLGEIKIPHDHQRTLGVYHKAGKQEVEMAIQASLDARKVWDSFRWEQRAAIFLKIAELLSVKYRYQLIAGAMLAGGKTVFQAEIDATCELIDFLRYNVYFAEQIYATQPQSSAGIWNYTEYRPLEGFILAVTPFNFTAIAGNLPTAPAIMGNTVVWKPASSLVYTPYLLMRIFEEAGLPPGVINFIPGSGETIGKMCLEDARLAGVHYTGSTRVFHGMWKTIAQNIEKYVSYPRLVGETGGKDFVFAHSSAEIQSLVTALVRGAFEYQGQKCSAASRAYIPASIWPAVKSKLGEEIGKITVGPPTDFRNFMGAVIDQAAFTTIQSYIDQSRNHSDAEILFGGKCNGNTGYFVQPTVILAKKPDYVTMVEEIFGPVLTIYVYEDSQFAETLELCDRTSAYGLTGAIFAKDRTAINLAMEKLVHAAGNFYINDKPTGAVVGQQPFGGGRASGTNDKAGAATNLLRWVSMRTVKETFLPLDDFSYPFMEEE